MRIFASWSGEESKQIAELLKTWIPCVLQEADVYVSSQDIGKGERWLSSVTSNLSEIDFGIIVVTKSNMNAPWILFEAGALSKSVKGFVVPLLCGIDTFEAATSPLTQFQYVRAVRQEMKDLIDQTNSVCPKPLDSKRIDAAFDKWWPDFESAYSAIKLPDTKPAKKENDASRLSNIEEALGEVMLELRRVRRSQDRASFTTIPNAAISPAPLSEVNYKISEMDTQEYYELRRQRLMREREAERRRRKIEAVSEEK